MKVKYIKNEEGTSLIYGNIYNVFSIEIGKDKSGYNLYISNEDSRYCIWPFDVEDFEIIDNKLSYYFTFGIDEQGDIVIGPEELYKMDFFWWNYGEELPEYIAVIDKYYKIAKDELFNYIPK